LWVYGSLHHGYVRERKRGTGAWDRVVKFWKLSINSLVFLKSRLDFVENQGIY
jgi:hypothetical protein